MDLFNEDSIFWAGTPNIDAADIAAKILYKLYFPNSVVEMLIVFLKIEIWAVKPSPERL